MGISSVGTSDLNSLKEITYTGLSGAGNTTTYLGGIQKHKIVPAGNYEVELISNGTVSLTSGSASEDTLFVGSGAPYASMIAYDAVSGRPIAWYQTTGGASAKNDPLAGTFSIPKDSYLQITIRNQYVSSNNIKYNVVLKPSSNLLKTQISFSMNTGVTASTSMTSHFIMGWDYDNDEPSIIWGYGSTEANGIGNSLWKQFGSQFFSVRKINGVWGQKTFNHNLASGNTWYFSTLRPGVCQQHPCGNGGFYIKNNILHWFNPQGVLVDASSNRWGWIKADISGATGSSINWSPGHSNTGFADSSSNIAATNSGNMLYWYDAKTHKVIYNGYRTSSNTDNLYAKWYEYDIATDTVTSQVNLGSYNAYVYTSGYGYLWDNYWCSPQTGYFGGIVQGVGGSLPLIIQKFAKDQSQINYKQYPNIYFRGTNSNTANVQGAAPVGFSGEKAIHWGKYVIPHAYISGVSKTATPYAIIDDSGFMTQSVCDLAGYSSNSNGVNNPKSQIMFAANKICVATEILIAMSTQDTLYSSSTPWTAPLLQLSTMPRTRITEGLLLNGTGGFYDPANHTANPNVYWLPDASTY